jgi:hypothetical protein
MLRADKRKLRFFIGLLAIAGLYSVYVLYLSDLRYVQETSRGIRHAIRFSTILVAYGIGVFAFAKESPGWLVQIWHLLYIGMLLLLILLGFYDAAVKELSLPLRELVITLHEFLISPIPYVIAGIIRRAVRPEPTS